MRPQWRLAISSVSVRPSRTILLIAAVALSAALIAAVSCAMASITAAVSSQMDQTVGRAQVRLKAAGRGGTMPISAIERVRGWEETLEATGRATGTLTLMFRRWAFVQPKGEPSAAWLPVEALGTAVANGIDVEREPRFRALTLAQGRWPQNAQEIVLDQSAIDALGGLEKVNYRVITKDQVGSELPAWSADVTSTQAGVNERLAPRLGDTIQHFRAFREPLTFTLVGISTKPPLGMRWQSYVTFAGLERITGEGDRVVEVDVVVKPGIDPAALVERRRPELGAEYLLQTTERMTSELDNNMKANELGFVVATLMAFLAASFIIMTGLATGLTEKERELAVLRCIGATKGQLAGMQLLIGAVIGGIGGIVGVPLGVAAAYAISLYYKDQLPTGMQISWMGLVIALAGALGAGLLGAVFPAFKATRVSPLEGLSVRAKPARARTLWLLAGVGIGLLLLELAVVFIPENGQTVFWGYATVGLPSMFLGYFLLGAPLLVLVSKTIGAAVNRVMGLPKGILVRNVRATPFRYGFTASAMMSGLAVMVALWTQGRSIMDDWLERFEFPDAFVTGIALTPEAQDKLNAMPFVTGTCAITLQPIRTNAFGVKALQKYQSMFIAFEPEPFFRMTRLTWVEPTDKAGQERAQRRLQEGGAILVAREFQVAQGAKVGDMFTAQTEDRSHEFEIVGVVTSPGLEVVSKFFAIGETFTDQAIHAVFGSRDDLKSKFNSSAINLIQVGLAKDVDDNEALATIRTQLAENGLLDAGSGRRMKDDLRDIIGASLVVASSIAVFAMVVASFGVANIIVAGIHARRFEFGVLRAVGASRGVLLRLVLGEAVLIAVVAMILGTALGLQGIFSGQRLDRLLFGLELTVKPPVVPILAGWVFVLVITVLAAVPAALQVARREPRELLAARG
jgi:putative ABC transport system permease protein